MKRIMFLTTSLGFGGAEKMLTFVANQLSLRGYKIGIINLNSVPNYVNEKKQSIASDISVFEIHCNYTGISSYFYDLYKTIKFVCVFHPDILIGFAERPNLIAKLAGDICGIPSIMSERGDPNRTNGRKGTANKIVAAIIDKSCGGVFQTKGASEFYSSGLQKRGVIIPNPIFVNQEIKYEKKKNKTVVSVGRLDNVQKRYDIMLYAFNEFHKKHPEYILKIYGEGSDKEYICSIISDLKINQSVMMMGLSSNPMQDIANDGIFLITSDYEGISNSLLEAMAVGLPCVSTDHTPGGARLLIKDHKTGLLSPIRDIKGIADNLSEFAENEQLSSLCGKNAMYVKEKFAPSKIIDLWEKYILRICEKYEKYKKIDKKNNTKT